MTGIVIKEKGEPMSKVTPKLNTIKLPRAMYCGFSPHDDECIYKCPKCYKIFGDWSVKNSIYKCSCGTVSFVK